MPNRDRYHTAVKNALINDGWNITHDPLRLSWGKQDMYVDLAAEQLLTAERDGKQIAVEIKTFGGPSVIAEIEQALGQFCLYRSVMKRTEPNRILYLAVHEEVFQIVFEEPVGQLLIEDYALKLLIFDPMEEVVLRWIP